MYTVILTFIFTTITVLILNYTFQKLIVNPYKFTIKQLFLVPLIISTVITLLFIVI
ncbi:hypothetical protein LYSIN_02949 [Lysinibacillus sphaericus]|uniref:Uncharacterized protein n=1 Tax=Lysinibacillus sphaericus TaxID=1421 RepID=A0A2S5D507_LYSSH|nr:hypothetical protein T479_02560 [Lysinibacillus varians]POZ58165.1 hypothetical protein LYSIN_02949 [Lysinibacillus sphaericus]